MACCLLWHWQAPFGASSFFHASAREPQILCIGQNTKNFQLFSGVTSEGTGSPSAWLRQNKRLDTRAAEYSRKTAARPKHIFWQYLSGRFSEPDFRAVKNIFPANTARSLFPASFFRAVSISYSANTCQDAFQSLMPRSVNNLYSASTSRAEKLFPFSVTPKNS